MSRNRIHTLALGALLTLIVAGCAEPVLAGPPLLCQTIEIGEAKSLPWAGPNWRDVRKVWMSTAMAWWSAKTKTGSTCCQGPRSSSLFYSLPAFRRAYFFLCINLVCQLIADIVN